MRMSEANELRARIAALEATGLKPREIARQVGCALSTVYKARQRPGPDRRALWDRPANRVDATMAAEVLALAAEDPTRRARAIQAILARAREAELADAAAGGGAEAIGAPGAAAGPAGAAATVPSLRTIERLTRRLDEVDAGEGGEAGLEGGCRGDQVNERMAAGPHASGRAGVGPYGSPGWDDYSAVGGVEADSLEDEIRVLRAAVRRNSRRLAEEPLEEGERRRVESHVRGLVESLAVLVRSRPRSGPSLAAIRAVVAATGRRKTGWDERLDGRAGAPEPRPGSA
jgi:transposase